MQLFYIALQIILDFFAVLGIYAFITKLLDHRVQKRAGAVCTVHMEKCAGDAEYAIRFAESRFLSGDYADFFDGITLSDEVEIEPDTYERLNREFGNLRRTDTL